MRKLIVLCMLLGFTNVLWAETLVGEVEVNGRNVLLFADGSWHYSSGEGFICLAIEERVDVCPNHGDWHPFPNASLRMLDSGNVMFLNGSTNIAVLTVWTKDELEKLEQMRGSGLALDEENMKRLITIRAKNRGMNALVIGRLNTEVSGKPAKTVVTLAGTVKVFTYFLLDDLALLLEVSFPNTTLFTKDKQMLLQKLVDSIVIKDQ